jgi:hypothetical protein
MSDDTEKNTNSSFAVALVPEFNEDGSWSGAVMAHIEEDVKDDLKDEELTQIRSVCGMLASCLPLLEQDPEFCEYVQDFFLQNYKEMISEYIEDTGEDNAPAFTRSEDGKVITLDFSTKTYGSA